MSKRSQKWTVLAMTFNIHWFCPHFVLWLHTRWPDFHLWSLSIFSPVANHKCSLSHNFWMSSLDNLIHEFAWFSKNNRFSTRGCGYCCHHWTSTWRFHYEKIRSKCKDCEEYEIPACVSKHVVYKKERELLWSQKRRTCAVTLFLLI